MYDKNEYKKYSIAEYFNRKAVRHGLKAEAVGYRSENSFNQRYRQLMRQLSKINGKRILDAGCGHGMATRFLAKQNTVMGIDLSEEMLKLAKERLCPVLGDIAELPFQDQCFDFVLSLETVQMTRQPNFLLRELCRVLKPRGELIISSINQKAWAHRLFSLWDSYEGLYFHDARQLISEVDDLGVKAQEYALMAYPLPMMWRKQEFKLFEINFASSWMMRGTKSHA